MSVDAQRPVRKTGARSAIDDGSIDSTAAQRRRSNIALFLLSFTVFILSPVKDTRSDPKYSILVSESILKHGTPALNEVSISGLDQLSLPAHPDMNVMRPFYQLVRLRGHVLYAYPQGSSLLSLPLVALINAAGVAATDSKGNYDAHGELWVQTIISSFLMAAVTCIFFETAGVLLPWCWSMLIAIGAVFGTQVWSTASRALWSHTWEVLLAACVVLLLLKRETKSTRPSGPVLATLVSWMYFVRPSAAIVVVALSILYLFCYRSEFIRYAATGLIWLGSFVVYSWAFFGQSLPDYYRRGAELHVSGWPAALAGCLISPSRGLLIFVPSVLLVWYLIVRYWKELCHRRLVVLSIGIIGGQLIMISSWPVWWGGWSYGPRLFTDMIPWFVLLAILGSRAYLDDSARIVTVERRYVNRRWMVPIGLSLIAISIGINGYGAISIQTRLWNARPNIDKHRERLWDWRHPQFLAGFYR